MSYPAGTIIVASDRQYKVNERGEWRRLDKMEEVKGAFKRPPSTFHNPTTGRSWDGSKCWCFECIQMRKSQ